jgi:hypothetical protein
MLTATYMCRPYTDRVFYKLLLDLLSFFFWTSCCLSFFNLLLLITSLWYLQSFPTTILYLNYPFDRGLTCINVYPVLLFYIYIRGRRGRDRMVVGFTTTYAISANHHWCCLFESRSGRGVQHYVIKFVSDLRQVGGFLRVLRFPPPIKTDRHDITEILLKVTLNTINQKQTNKTFLYLYFKPT